METMLFHIFSSRFFFSQDLTKKRQCQRQWQRQWHILSEILRIFEILIIIFEFLNWESEFMTIIAMFTLYLEWSICARPGYYMCVLPANLKNAIFENMPKVDGTLCNRDAQIQSWKHEKSGSAPKWMELESFKWLCMMFQFVFLLVRSHFLITLLLR